MDGRPGRRRYGSLGRHRAARRRRGDPGHRRRRPALPPHHQPRGRHRRRRRRWRCGPARRWRTWSSTSSTPPRWRAPGNFLISEAVRGEGAILLDADGERFMLDFHPTPSCPRDVVARGIADADGAPGRRPGAPGRHRTSAGEFLARRFPTIDAALPASGFAWDVDADPGHPCRALLDGRRPHRPLGPHLGARPVRGRRGRPAPACTGPTGWPPTHCSRAGLRRPGRQGLGRRLSDSRRCRATTTATRRGARRSPWTSATGADASPTTASDLQDLMWESVGLAGPPPDCVTRWPRSAAGGRRRSPTPRRTEDANLLLVGPGRHRQRTAAYGVPRRPLPRRLPRHRPDPGRPLRPGPSP